MVTFWEVVDRTNTGPRMGESEWDKTIFRKTQEIVKEFEIEWDRETIVPSDNSLADDVFRASVNLLVDVGGYCMGTGRIVKFTEEEIRQHLKSAPAELTVGVGKDARKIIHRDVEDKREPNMFGRGMAPFEEGDLTVKFAKAVAELLFVDGYLCPNLLEIEGRKIKGLAYEIHASKYSVLWAREGVGRAHRPGLFIMYYPISTHPATMISALDPELGVRKTDGILISPIPELKLEANLLGVTAAALDYGCTILSQPGSSLGGFAGGPEGASVVAVACSILSILAYRAQILPGVHSAPVMVNYWSSPMNQWVEALSLQAINRNTHLIAGGIIGSLLAGPCTEMALYEAMYRSLVYMPNGSMIVGTRPFAPRRLNLCTPLEVRWAYECGTTASQFKREEANEMAKRVYKKFEDKVEKPPEGKALTECYDVRTMTPNEEYLTIYRKVRKDLIDMGFELCI